MLHCTKSHLTRNKATYNNVQKLRHASEKGNKAGEGASEKDKGGHRIT